jgi:hypothetical protein
MLMYKLEFDGRAFHLTILAPALWCCEDADALVRDVTRSVAARRNAVPAMHMLVDLRTSTIQAGEIAERLGRMSAAFSHPLDRVAGVVGSVLKGKQFARVMHGAHVNTFMTVADAKAWLDSEWKASQAPD